ncbi:hypothetical protein KC669_02515 [Candidatus Dojkabacteria bacterium]|uniref:Tissue inhibitor of metalloproteinase n=1 Tax=Candidatus Dojkabacteria bacterium TaxID=2099670 RepID=A0A955LBC5_9BACT|nr:hypothetical protein [Candidatus Dojkabacteria bacterium]
MKKIYFLATFIIISIISTSTVAACSCIQPGTPTEEANKGQIIFSGTVESITEVDDLNLQVNVKPIMSWTSDLLSLSTPIATTNNSAACGYNFEEGKDYLIYAYEHEGNLSTNICTRTQLLDTAALDIPELNQLNYKRYDYTVQNNDNTEQTTDRDSNALLIVLIALFSLGLLSYILVKRTK